VERWWKDTQPAGAATTLAEAFTLGAAIFGDRLLRLVGRAT
jgi:hypothetical protein